MAKRKNTIESYDIFEDVKILGITSSLVEYKIAIAFDRKTHILFKRLPDIADENNTPYSFYLHKIPDSETSYNIIGISNKKLHTNWLGNIPLKIDYLLIIRGSDATDNNVKKILSKMSGYPNITIYQLEDYNPTMKKVMSSIERNILEAAEMHELEYDPTIVSLRQPNISSRRIKREPSLPHFM